MKAKSHVRPQGQLRQSQLITTFGPGAMIDLPSHSVIVGGLESWGDPIQNGFAPIREDRLLEKVRNALQRQDTRLFAPPIDHGDPTERSGIVAWQFPEWFVAQHDEIWGDSVRSRRLLHRRELVQGKYFGPDKKKHSVVPMRFVQACVRGHISDIDWHTFVHGPGNSCKRKLWLDERGTSGDLADVAVRCECSVSRSLAVALRKEGGVSPLGYCRGQRPWLGAHAGELCGGETGKAEPNRLLVRSATNAYFPQVLSVISIPESDALLKKAIDPIWDDFLVYVENLDDLRRERRKARVLAALEGFDDPVVMAEIERRRAGIVPPDKSIKEAEIETLLAQKPSVGEDVPESDFYACTMPLVPASQGPMSKVERVVLVHRLREVIAQIGFTRFEAEMPDIDGELSLDVRRASISREANWVPAIENRGEGVLIAFKQAELHAWVNRPKVAARVKALHMGFEAWASTATGARLSFPGPRYVMLHSLAHLLIASVSLASGYAASAIRERVYVTDAGCGILLYTGTPDAEGTLGGLVQLGRNIETHLRNALELGALCSNDPVCAQHRPDNRQEERFLHGAACHGCLLIAEPSCERRNDYLDRALVMPTVEELGAEFFGKDEL